jgi:cyclopropane fatty-acyl-phospholipid synthase-like methyltransferase
MSTPEFYDKVFSETPHYQGPPEDSPYYVLWKEILEKLMRGKKRVLDVGCGPGQFAELCVAAGHEYIGLDWSSKAIELAEARDLDIELHNVDVEKNPEILGKFSYDLATFIEFMEHVKLDREILASVPSYRQVILSVPDYPARTHFRQFKTLDHAAQRYEPFLNITNRLIFRGTSSRGTRNLVFVLKGTRCGRGGAGG